MGDNTMQLFDECVLNKCMLLTYLMQTGVLDMIRRNRLLSFDFYINVHADGSGHGRFVRALICIQQSDKVSGD